MNKRFLCGIWYAISICLTGGTHNPTIAASQLSWGHTAPFCGVIDDQQEKQHSNQYSNRHYAQTSVADLNVGEPRTVRLIYFLPNDRPYRANVVQRMKDEIREIQTFYAEQMEAHGYGKTTFRVETDSQGEPIVHRVDGQHPDRYYLGNALNAAFAETDRVFNRKTNIYFIIIDNSINRIRSSYCRYAGIGDNRGKSGGYASVAIAVEQEWLAHELGHAFGLKHNFSDNAYIMSYGSERDRLSACSAKYLSVHPYFNLNIPIEKGQAPTIELISHPQYLPWSKSIPIQLKVSDSEGLHQILLHTKTIEPHAGAGFWEVITCRSLTGETDTLVEFDYNGVIPSNRSTNLFNPLRHPVAAAAVDIHGNVAWEDYVLFSETLPPLSKISGNNQRGLPDTPLPVPFVVQVRDVEYYPAPRRYAVTFTVTAGGGTLSVEHTETDDTGRAKSTLTLGPHLGPNTVEVSVAGIEGAVTFSAVAGAAVAFPDPNLRAAVEAGLNKAEGAPIVPSEMVIFSCLTVPGASIHNLTGLESAINLTGLDLLGNNISDISPVAGLVSLKWIDLSSNNVSDISPLAANTGLRHGDTVYIRQNPLSYQSIYTHIPMLQSRGVTVYFENQAHPALVKISGDNQHGIPSASLTSPFVIEVQDKNGSALAGAPVTFTVIAGGGRLSITSTTTDENGRAESTLTLGPNIGRNAIKVSVVGIESPLTFYAISDTGSPPITADVNHDGTVNILDLVSVASEYGNQGRNLAADINEDRIVDIFDLILVAGMFADTAAAPLARPQVPETLTAVKVQGWLTDVSSLELRDPTVKRGLVVLEQLLVSLTPRKTELLANYPNPFNPETWIPYRLGEDTFVTLKIYDTNSRIIRTLDVGHRIAAAYEGPSRALHWDGKNDLGEPVASGVYFYTLTAGDYSATRKMVILK